MNNSEHENFKIGDEVTVGHDLHGCMVCNISYGFYSENFPKGDW